MLVLLTTILLLIAEVYEINILTLVVLYLWFIKCYFGSKTNLIYQVLLITFFVFHILPITISLLADNYRLITHSIDVGKIVYDDPLKICLILTISMITMAYYRPQHFRWPKFSMNEKYISIDYLILIVISLIAYYGKYLIIRQVWEVGYINFHLGADIEKRSPIFFFIEYLFLYFIALNFKNNRTITNYIFAGYAILNLLSGMRLPFVAMITTLILLNVNPFRKFLISKVNLIVMSLLFLVFLGLSQLLRTGADLESYSLTDFLLFSAEAQIFSLSATNDLLMLILHKGSNLPYNPLYYILDMISVLQSKLGGYVLTMNERIENGNLGYYLYSLHEPERFKLGITGGGTFLGEVFFYYGVLGISFFMILIKQITFSLNKIIQVQNSLGIFILLSFTPSFYRLWRDNYFNMIYQLIFTLAMFFVFAFTRKLIYSLILKRN